MPYKIELTWHGARNCWKKYYRGKHYYFGKGSCRGKSDMTGYKLALEEWKAKKHELDGMPDPQQQMGIDARGIDPTTAATFATSWEGLSHRPAAIAPASIAERRLEPLSNLFLAGDLARAKAGQISNKEYMNRKAAVDDFLAFARGKAHEVMSGNDGLLLLDYRQALLYLMNPKPADKKHQISGHTACRRLKHVKRLYEWAWKANAIQGIPRTLDRSFTRIDMPAPHPQFYSPDEVRTLFNAATPRTKLYIALALNCGYRQTDIATLDHRMIDWDQGIIERDRHKTKKKGIRQRHKLWPVTLQLLKAEAGKGPGTVLLSQNGTKLYRDQLTGDDGVYRHMDVIALAFARLTRKLKFPTGKTFKMFRSTGANAIAQKYQRTPEVTDLYLGHAIKGLRLHYAAMHYDLLFKALEHLDSVYQLKA